MKYKMVMFLCICFFMTCFASSISPDDLNEIKNGIHQIYVIDSTAVLCQTMASVAIFFIMRWLKQTLIHNMENLIQSNMSPLIPQTIGVPAETLEHALENFLPPHSQDEIV